MLVHPGKGSAFFTDEMQKIRVVARNKTKRTQALTACDVPVGNDILHDEAAIGVRKKAKTYELNKTGPPMVPSTALPSNMVKHRVGANGILSVKAALDWRANTKPQLGGVNRSAIFFSQDNAYLT